MQLTDAILAERIQRQRLPALIRQLKAELDAERDAVWEKKPIDPRGSSPVSNPKGSQAVAEKWVGMVTAEEATKILEAVRERAGSWRDGTGVVLGLITATLVIGGDTYDAIAGGPLEVQLLIVAAAALALGSLFLALRAAHGPAFLDTKIRETVEPAADRDMRRAGAAARNLHQAQGALGAGAVAFLLALMLLWWMT